MELFVAAVQQTELGAWSMNRVGSLRDFVVILLAKDNGRCRRHDGPTFFSAWWRHRLKKNNPVIWALCLLGCFFSWPSSSHLISVHASCWRRRFASWHYRTDSFWQVKNLQPNANCWRNASVTYFSLYRISRRVDLSTRLINQKGVFLFFLFSFVVIYLWNKNSHFRIRCNRNKLEPQGVYRSNRNSSRSCEWT
jgi:hypothetical protein